MTPTQLALLVLLLPLASAAVIALFLRRAGEIAAVVSVLAAAGIATGALILAFGNHRFEATAEWLRLGDFSFPLGFKFDDLAALMLFVVGVVGFFIHVFSFGYMREDTAKARYFGGLSIFMFSMIGITVADNLFMMFVFWELVGFSSWLLIGHWHERPSASAAAKKAFIVNRVGDFGFLLGIAMCYWVHGTVTLSELDGVQPVGALLPLLLFCGAVGKSAQMPLQVWLPDAMEGPTPVSALIHAATMVAAGIYMLCRINVLMVPEALTVIMWVGTATALYAALCAIVQSDIKKVLAYSTLSQLGYMVAAFGLGSLAERHEMGGAVHEIVIAAGVGAAMFHLVTHAFFKALLFLGSGSVIHGCHHEQDIFKMGGLVKRMPVTFATFTIGVLAIIGMPGLAGFFSKDAILLLAYQKNAAVFVVLAFTAILTACYMVRVWKITFFGAPRSEHAEHAHESGSVLTMPLIVLAALAILGGYIGLYPDVFTGVLDLVPEAHGSTHTTILLTSLAVMVIGAGAGYAFYRPGAEDALAVKSPGAFTSLVGLRNSFDAAYDYYVAKVQQRFAMLLNFLEQIFLAGLIIRGLAGVVGLFGLGARAVHVGKLNAYVYWFLGGVAVLWLFAKGVL
ncbi:NADH-quinone oxidoreductase subunit L [Opitutus terrae]|uniref:Proton-translocating NADH-quinone oxidoreductase, chain L n=1 Tax=Opitutus terrae (strain DSM 11246 / JCM 15787 / PB90-1) TaxID=452637 RepID=B1ZRS2_OPITP|nr:NADH-quinone oxidoreductase subunit L [Opitutus terrae]ACB73765.1 proton-translocating NADH-quinone oxidoreductase, chain L [Opitutus terrae PB90-1]